MKACLLDGKKLAAQIKTGLSQDIISFQQTYQRQPALAVVLVGNDPASEIYVANKRKACTEVGITSHAFDLPATTSTEELLKLVEKLNQDPCIDGILVQLPLPDHIDTTRVIEALDPGKDIDGFHPYNLGRLAQRSPNLRPCTPYGIIQLLQAYKLPFYGQHAVVVGASNIVGRPMALELLLAGSTVTLCHRFTQNIERHIRMADMIVIAAGKYGIINPEWLNDNQVVIDVGIHRNQDGKIHGDIDFDAASQRVAYITPVPGGVGPMTITALLQNTLQAAKQRKEARTIRGT